MTSQHFVLSLKDEQGALHFPLMRPRCPQNIWKVCVCKCACPCSLTFPLLMSLRASDVHRCGCASGFLHTLANTHFTHNPWHFLSWSHVSDLIGYCINNTALTQLPTPHRQHITYRRFDRLSLSFHVCSGGDWGWFGFCLHICPRCWSRRARGWTTFHMWMTLLEFNLWIKIIYQCVILMLDLTMILLD